MSAVKRPRNATLSRTGFVFRSTYDFEVNSSVFTSSVFLLPEFSCAVSDVKNNVKSARPDGCPFD